MSSEAQKQQIIQQYQALMEREKELLARVAEMQGQESEYRFVSSPKHAGVCILHARKSSGLAMICSSISN